MTDHEKTDGVPFFDRKQFSWRVTDGQGDTMYEGLDEMTALKVLKEDDSYTIGWLATDAGGGPEVNDDDVPITYANKDILNEEDLK